MRGLERKLKNRRVSLFPLPNNEWMLEFKRLESGRKIIKTNVRLSDEGLQALITLYFEFRGELN